MFVQSLTLQNFRNHKYLSFDFEKGINILEGSNAVGKTNIVEAIHYLSLAKSFRANEDEELIQKEKELAVVDAVIHEGDIKRKIRVNLSPTSKKIFINNKQVNRLSDLSKIMNVILFEPNDVMLFKSSPKDRRNFLDVSLSKKSEPYFDYISRYEKVLKERNELLKQGKIDETLLEATTELLIKLSGPIVSYRQMYVKDINNILIKITRALTGAHEKIEIIYKPFVPYNKDFISNAKKAFDKSKEKDLIQKATSIGIHREDFSVNLDGRDIGIYGSQGENRIVAIALKLSPYFLIEDKDKRPVVVLDDVMSELDDEHRQNLINFLKQFEQVFITATSLKIDGAAQYLINRK